MRLGVFQPDCGGMDAAKRLHALEHALVGQRLDLVLCPELFMSGYNIKGSHQGLAEPADGPFAQAVRDLARRHNTAICYGYPEAADGVVYNAALLLGPDGQTLANHRKRIAAPHCFEGDIFTNGAGATLVDFAGLKLAIVICYEVEFPEFVREAAQMGAELLLAPTALVNRWAVVAKHLIPTRAFENGIWLAYANHAGSESGQNYYGNSQIVTPFGEVAAAAGDQPELIQTTITPAVVTDAQTRLPYLADLVKLPIGTRHND